MILQWLMAFAAVGSLAGAATLALGDPARWTEALALTACAVAAAVAARLIQE